jgi:xanthine dehydrogenase YagR molybdenum-binding subunit
MGTTSETATDTRRQTAIVGTSVPRVDGPLKVTGGARFAAEVPMEGLTYAAVLYSSIARGEVSGIDTTRADAAPGVVLTMTYRNAPRMAAPPQIMVDPDGAALSNLPVMQDAEVHWNGEPVALVLAETQPQADHAVSLIDISYVEWATHTSFDAAKGAAECPDNVLGEAAEIALGDAEGSLAAAEHVVDAIYRTPRHSHATMELPAVTVAWEGDTVVVHDSSQALNLTQATLARVFGIEVADVQVLSPFVGGSFGGRTVWSHHLLACAAAKLAGRPVRLALTREGVFRSTGGRTLTEQRVALGAATDGRLTSLIHTGTAAMSFNNIWPEQFTFPARHLYAADTMLLTQKVVELDVVANTAMRAPGESIGTFALESAVDELATAMRLDPIELRRRIEPTNDPTTGQPFSSRNYITACEVGAKRFGWWDRDPQPRSRRDGEWLVGQGMAGVYYPYYRMPGGTVGLRLSVEGRVVASCAGHEMGMGTATVQAQLLADRLGLPVDCVAFEYGDTDAPPTAFATGSSQTVTTAAAMDAAAETLTAELLRLAGDDSPLTGLSAHEVEARDGSLCSRSNPARTESFSAILARAGQREVRSTASAAEPDEMARYSMHSYGAHFCEVRVSAVTGEVRVTRWLGSFDIGRVVNPRTAASQLRGGIIMGLGLALTEEMLFDDRTGRIVNPSLAEYHVPVHLDVPEIDVIWTDLPDPQSPFGLRGVGEIGITGVGAAVANAIHHATGARLRDLPFTPDKLLATGH